ncbi:hypothetical protein BDV98DRAFT_570233 [Pterulicium gracile]|uniref:Uncharacterized protein n=1 Tax=Pterulicium gracile TaxID=1884261 RepID=A0A5C3QFA7_9AGAR|nr:hypothetical protein BDV98DRAFT_570233 [Pterula gracilis]
MRFSSFITPPHMLASLLHLSCALSMLSTVYFPIIPPLLLDLHPLHPPMRVLSCCKLAPVFSSQLLAIFLRFTCKLPSSLLPRTIHSLY